MNLFDAQIQAANGHSGTDLGDLRSSKDARVEGKPSLIDINNLLADEYEYRQSFDKNGKVKVVKVRVKRIQKAEQLKGGLADGKTPKDLAKKHKVNVLVIERAIEQGVKVEMEHTDSKEKAREIALDHIFEDVKYYTKLKKIEKKK